MEIFINIILASHYFSHLGRINLFPVDANARPFPQMDAFDFVIPLSLDALQESTSTRQYVVYNISTSKEIPKKIQGEVVLGYKY